MLLKDAHVLCYRLFDIGDEIDLERCRLLVANQGESVRRLQLKREGAEYLQLSNPPLAIDIGTRELTVSDEKHAVQLSARLFDFGAVSIQARVPVHTPLSIGALIPFADALYDSEAVTAMCQREVERLEKVLAEAIQKPHHWSQSEAYSVIWVTGLGQSLVASEVLKEPALPRLLLGEVIEPDLSLSESAEVLKHHFSYGRHDLAVIEWNAALVIEPSGSEDILDMLEMANAQLLQLRYYDEVLDSALSRSYDDIGRPSRVPLIFSPYTRNVRELMRTLIELSEFIERAENAIKIVGDVYLARVYESALDQFRIPEWTAQVSRKHRLLQQTYALLKGEVDTSRTLTLEVMVVLLILFEVVMASSKWFGH
jgi:hypothetical protein